MCLRASFLYANCFYHKAMLSDTKLKLILICISSLVAASSKAWVCGRSHAEIVGTNPTGEMDVCLL
jgi:hypothetical protein